MLKITAIILAGYTGMPASAIEDCDVAAFITDAEKIRQMTKGTAYEGDTVNLQSAALEKNFPGLKSFAEANPDWDCTLHFNAAYTSTVTDVAAKHDDDRPTDPDKDTCGDIPISGGRGDGGEDKEGDRGEDTTKTSPESGDPTKDCETTPEEGRPDRDGKDVKDDTDAAKDGSRDADTNPPSPQPSTDGDSPDEGDSADGDGDKKEDSKGDSDGKADAQPDKGEDKGDSPDKTNPLEDLLAPKPQPKTPVEEPQPPMPETKEDTEPQPKAKKPPVSTEDKITRRIEVGIRNLWLYGPAGCGKTTVCGIVAEKMNRPCFVLSCCKDTDPAQIRGKIYPEATESELIKFFEQPSIIILDEFTSCEDATAMLLNSALANGEILAATGRIVKRHPDCVIIATSNTTGEGGDELYCGNNRLDASTLDRFAGNFIEVNYSAKYEKKYDPECVEFVRKLRKVVTNNTLQRIVSTRLLQTCCLLKQAGFDWKKEALASWTEKERKTAARMIEGVVLDSPPPEDDDDYLE